MNQTDNITENAFEQLSSTKFELNDAYFAQPITERLQDATWNGKAVRVGINRTEIDGGFSYFVLVYFGEGDDSHYTYRIDQSKNEGPMGVLEEGKPLSLGSFRIDRGANLLEIELSQEPQSYATAA